MNGHPHPGHNGQGSSVIVLSSAEYDVYNAAQLEVELLGLRGPACVLDFIRVRYFDSTSLGLLIHALKRLRTENSCSTITLVNVARPLRRIFELTKLSEVFALK